MQRYHDKRLYSVHILTVVFNQAISNTLTLLSLRLEGEGEETLKQRHYRRYICKLNIVINDHFRT